MCFIDVVYCLVCKEIIHRKIEICDKTKERYVCIDMYIYDDDKTIVVRRPDGSWAVDLARLVRSRRNDSTCQRCYDIGIEQFIQNKKSRPYNDQGYYSD